MRSDLEWIAGLLKEKSSSVDTVMNKHSQCFPPIEFQGQKRNSTDAGVQTEPVAVAPAAEKSK